MEGWLFSVLLVVATLVALVSCIRLRRYRDAAKVLRQVLATVDHAIMVYDAGWRLRFWSKNAADIMGYPPELIERGAHVGMFIGHYVDCGVFGPGERTSLVEEKLRLFASHPELEQRMRLPNGRFCIYRRWPVANGGFLVLAIDVSDLKTAETRLQDANEEIRRVNRDLERRVEERTEELRLAKEAAEAASRTKSRFLANMSHELRTPMNGVLGMLNLLENGELSEEQRRRARTAKDCGENLLRLIQDVLDFSRSESGAMELDIETFDLPLMLDSALYAPADSAAAKGVRFTHEIHGKLPRWVSGDPSRLRQVVSSLVANAVKFTDEGEVRIVVGIRGEPQDARERCRLRVDISDTGCGISPEARDNLFQAFTQADASTTRRFDGAGLGLAICRKLVELMGGELGCESIPLEGSTFWFSVPLSLAESPIAPSASARSAELEAFQKDDKRVLLVEDNPINQLVTMGMLESFGLKCDLAADGCDAVSAVSEKEYDLILMDCQMPRLDGYQATRQIRESESTRGDARIPIVAVTANVLRGDREQCLAAGMDDYVPKPVEKETLERVLHDWLS